MILESLIVSYLSLLGLFLTTSLKNIKIQLFIALPVSLIFWSLFYIISVISIFKIDFITYADNLLILNIFLIITSLYNILMIFLIKDFKIIKQYTFFAIAIFFITLILLNLDLPLILSADSYFMIDIFYSFKETLTLGFPLFFTTLQVWSVYISEDYYMASYLYLLSISFFIFLAYFMFFLLKDIQKDRIFISISIPIIIFSTFLGLYNAFYINHHLVVAFLYLITLFLFYKYKEEKREVYLYYGLFFITSTILMRMEIVVFSYIFIVLFFSDSKIDKKLFFKLLLFYTTVSTLWLGWYISILEKDSFIDPLQYIMIIIAMWGGLFILYMLNHLLKNSSIFWKNIDKIIILILFVGILLMFLTEFTHMLKGLYHIAINLFYHGGWGLFWFIILFINIYIFTNSYKFRDEHRKLLTFFIISILTLLLMMYFRNPYRGGFLDSGNRVIFQFSFFILVYSIFNFIKFLGDKNDHK
jgi:hypothetical protein